MDYLKKNKKYISRNIILTLYILLYILTKLIIITYFTLRDFILKILKQTSFILIVLIIFLLTLGSIQAENVTDSNETANIKTYNDLTEQINLADDESTLNLNESYKFNNNTDSDLTDGVKIKKNLTIKGANHSSIDGSHAVRGFFIAPNCNVTLMNLIIKNTYTNSSGAGIFLSTNSTLTLFNCVFENNLVFNSDGGAICTLENTNVFIHNCTFTNNTSVRESNIEWKKFKAGMGSAICLRIGSNLEIYESRFKANTAYLSTILVISYDDKNYRLSNLLVKGCTFEKNTNYKCGVIYLDERGKGDIIDSSFKSNVVSFSGSVLELDACLSCNVRNCIFEKNTCASGGAIKVKVYSTKYLSYVNVENCEFTKNTGAYGAIKSVYGVLTVSNCKFSQNTAKTYHGGGIYVEKGSVKITNCEFTSNKAKNGGALCFVDTDSTVTKSTFTKNTASQKGGAIFSQNTKLIISSSKFTQNTAKTSGGAIYTISKSAKITSSSFTKNTAKYGGAIFSKNTNLIISSSKFTQNTAKANGGAIYAYSKSIKITGSSFTKNSAIYGGAVYLYKVKSTLSKDSFSKNSAKMKGGAIFSKIKTVSISKCKYSGNKAKISPKVHGMFNVKLYQYPYKSKATRLKVRIASIWKMSASQKIKITVKGEKSFTSKWVKTSSKGIVSVKVPFKFSKSKYSVKITIQNGLSSIKSWTRVK